jgi:hypothetical protein
MAVMTMDTGWVCDDVAELLADAASRAAAGLGLWMRERKLLIRQSSANWRSSGGRMRNLQWQHPLSFALSRADRRWGRRGQGPALRG